MKPRCTCGKRFKTLNSLKNHLRDTGHKTPRELEALHDQRSDPDMKPDYDGECDVCGASPIVPVTGMCGPCTFGEAETIDGNW